MTSAGANLSGIWLCLFLFVYQIRSKLHHTDWRKFIHEVIVGNGYLYLSQALNLGNLFVLASIALGIVVALCASRRFSLSDKRFPYGPCLFIFSILLRVIVYFGLPEGSWNPGPVKTMFIEGLRNHLGEYLWVNAVKPPMNPIIWAIQAKLFDLDTIIRYRTFLPVSMLLLSLAVLLLYATAVRLTKNRIIPFFVMLVYSVALVAFELQEDGRHLDHPTLFLIPLMIYAWTRLIQDLGWKNLLLGSAAGTILVFQSIANSVIVPISFCVIVFGRARGNRSAKARALAVLLGPPVLLLLLLSAKNYAVSGTASPTTLGGMSRGFFFYERVFDDPKVIRESIVQRHMPDWYLWCYDHAYTPLDAEGQPLPGWKGFARMGGLCFPNNPVPGTACWPFDFRPLYQHLIAVNELQAAEIVRRDMEDACNRPFVFSGWHTLFSGRWIGFYGKYTDGLLNYMAVHFFPEYLEGLTSAHRWFLEEGPGHLRTSPRPNTPEWKVSRAKSWRVFNYYYERLLRIGYVLLPPLLLALILGMAGFPTRFSAMVRRWLKMHRETAVFFVAASSAIALTAFIFCQGAAYEQERYFMQETPYLMVLDAVGLYYLSRLIAGSRLEKAFNALVDRRRRATQKSR